MGTFLIWTGRGHVFKTGMTQTQAEGYAAACKRNYRGSLPPILGFQCEEVDPTEGDEHCSGLTGDPRCSGAYCLCRV